MNNIKKLYIKALNNYEKGYINKAIEICETIISIDIKNSAAINLKGLLCYFKGDLESSRVLWKLNYEVNNDGVSKKYLQSLKEDEVRFSMYVEAVHLIEKLKIRDALNILIKCKESDYNKINVYNAIATCYIDLEDKEKALSYTEEVLQLDRKNEVAVKNKKKIKNKRYDGKRILQIGCLFILIFGVIIAIKMIKTHKNNEVIVKKEVKKEAKKEVKREINKEGIKEDKKEQKEIFPYNDVSESLKNKDFNALYEYISAWRYKRLSTRDKDLVNRCEDVLKEEGTEYFYFKAKKYYKNDDNINNTIDNLERAYVYGKDSYLYGEIVFTLGRVYKKNGDIDRAIKYYIEYNKKFPKGTYSEEVLYKLANIYKDIDTGKAKMYGEKLVENYPNSQYNNSIIKSIINE